MAAVVAVIPARDGSKGLPNKNVKDFGGFPLYQWAIQCARMSTTINKAIVVTSDNEHIVQDSVYAGASHCIRRPKELAGDNVECIDAVDHAVREWIGNSHIPYGLIVVVLQPTSPLRSANEIDTVVNKLATSVSDAAVTVSPSTGNPYKMFWMEDSHLTPVCEYANTSMIRQKHEDVYSPNGNVFAFKWQSHVLNRGQKICGLHASRVLPAVTPKGRGYDIDIASEWVSAEQIFVRDHLAKSFKMCGRVIDSRHTPLFVAEIGINHNGSFNTAKQMVFDAYSRGVECVKFQCHIPEAEMSEEARYIVPNNANEDIYTIIERCTLSEEEEKALKEYTESLGMIYLCTPFSIASVDRLERLGVEAFKIGSGECNNIPLLKRVAKCKKPIILSTGMNDIESIEKSVQLLRKYDVPFALLHCTSTYPTPYSEVCLEAVRELHDRFPDAVVGLSDHTVGTATCTGSVALGANIIEKHFTGSKEWIGPDIEVSLDPTEVKKLLQDIDAVSQARGGCKQIHAGERKTASFAFACVVTSRSIQSGEEFTEDNLTVKRPGDGDYPANCLETLNGNVASRYVGANKQLRFHDVSETF